MNSAILATVRCGAEDHIEGIWQPKAAQNLLWELIITALILMIPCCLPLSCREFLRAENT